MPRLGPPRGVPPEVLVHGVFLPLAYSKCLIGKHLQMILPDVRVTQSIRRLHVSWMMGFTA